MNGIYTRTNHICSQEVWWGGRLERPWTYTALHRTDPGVLYRQRLCLRCKWLHVSVAARGCSCRRPPVGPEVPRTDLCSEWLREGFSPVLTEHDEGCLYSTTSIWSEQLSTAFLPSMMKANVGLSAPLDCHLRLFNKIEAAAVGTCGFFNSDVLVLPIYLTLHWS